MKIKFVRHGETDLNSPIRRMQGVSNYDFASVGGEKIENYKRRLKDFINDVQIKYNDKKVLVVCHNGVISVLSCILEGEPDDGNFENRGIKNGQIKEFIL